MKKLTVALAISISAVSLLAACGKKEAPPPSTTSAPSAPPATTAPAAAPTAAPAAAPAADNTVGKSTYNKVCSVCHAAGVAGAPKPGDKADWGPRIAQGKEVLYKHAIEGFTGTKGQMPARGANPALKDEEVKAAADYMADQSK